jgi:hypothetical protein
VTVCSEEISYLRALGILDDCPDPVEVGPGRTVTIHLSAAASDSMQSKLTERLASVGYDSSYRPTGEGKMIESLIDKLNSET